MPKLTMVPNLKIKFLKIGLLVILPFLSSVSVWSQSSSDSLKKLITRASVDTTLARLYYELGTAVYVAKPDSAKQLETAITRPEHARNATPFSGDLIGFFKMIKAPRCANIIV